MRAAVSNPSIPGIWTSSRITAKSRQHRLQRLLAGPGAHQVQAEAGQDRLEGEQVLGPIVHQQDARRLGLTGGGRHRATVARGCDHGRHKGGPGIPDPPSCCGSVAETHYPPIVPGTEALVAALAPSVLGGHVSAVGTQTGVPQHVLTAHREPAGQPPLASHAVKLPHEVLPGTQKPPPVDVVVQTQSGLLLHGRKLPQLAPRHSGLGLPPEPAAAAGEVKLLTTGTLQTPIAPAAAPLMTARRPTRRSSDSSMAFSSTDTPPRRRSPVSPAQSSSSSRLALRAIRHVHQKQYGITTWEDDI